MKHILKTAFFAAAFAVIAFFGAQKVHAAATNIYIAQSASGSANGSSCANAYAYSFFNSSSNWGSGANQIGPGTTVHICGTISVGANQEALVFNGSGTSGNPITLYFESGAVLTSPEWPADGSGGAIDLGSNSYVTVNGNGGTNGAVEGIIQATSNGDSGAACLSGSCTSHGDSNGVEASDGAKNVIIEGVTIRDMYVTASGVPNGGGGSCIYDHGNITNWTITGNTMHDMGWCINLQYDSGASSNLTISNNNIYNIDHGIALGGPHAGMSLTNVNVFGNYIHDYANWDTPGDVWHHDGIHIWGYNNNGSDPISNINIYDNKFGGNIGKNVTAHIFIETNSGNTTNVKIYNNTLIDTGNGQDNDGLLTTSDPGYQVYNNTFIGGPNDTCVGLSGSSNSSFYNNIVSGCGTLQYVTRNVFASGGLHNNVYAGCGGSGGNCFAFPGGYTSSLSAWQSYTGQDANSVDVSSANLNAAGVPQSGSAAIGTGANLTSLGIPALNADINGVARPASGAWDIGAYEVSSGSTGGGSGGGTVSAPVISSGGAASTNVGNAFNYQIAASNSPTSYGASGLPSGLSVNSGTGLISGTPSAAGTYSIGLSAANSGGTGTAVLTLTVSAAAPTTYTLTVTKSGTGSGSVTGSGVNCGSTCTVTVNSGATVTLSAAPSTGSTFSAWGGSCSGTGACSFAMTANKSVSASFGKAASTGDTTAPSVPSGLMATPSAQNQIVLSWNASTDNVGVSGYKIYRNGTQVATAGTTSYTDTGLTAGTKYTYTVAAYDAAGNTSSQSTSASATAAGPLNPPSDNATCSTIGSGWTASAVTASSGGTYTVSFDATPATGNVDSVIGLSTAAASQFNDMAAIVRFNDSGDIDAISGPGYTAASAYAYQGGTTYHFTITVNLSTKTYTATVKAPTGSTTTIALNYPFRDTQASASSLAYVDAHNDAGSTTLCNVTVNGPGPSTSNPAVPTITGISTSQATTNTTVVLTGSNFQGVTGINFYTTPGEGSLAATIPPSSISSNGTSLTFTIPVTFIGMAGTGTYSIQAVTPSAAGNEVSLTIVSPNSGPTTSTIALSGINPSSGAVGASVTLTGSGFGTTDTVLMNGMVAASNVSSNGSSITFSVPSSLAPNCTAGQACAQYLSVVSPGAYSVSVLTNSGATSNSLSFTVSSVPPSGVTTCEDGSTPDASGQCPGTGTGGDNSSSTIAALEAQIQSLLAEVAQLQAQLAAQNGGGSSGSGSTGSGSGSGSGSGHHFDHDLWMGSRGSDVTALQQLLINADSGSAAQQLSQYGATGYFGQSTKAALSEYQQEHGISPSSGYFGSITENYVNSH